MTLNPQNISIKRRFKRTFVLCYCRFSQHLRRIQLPSPQSSRYSFVDLPPALAAVVLPTLLEARVEVGANDALVELGAANVLRTIEGRLGG